MRLKTVSSLLGQKLLVRLCHFQYIVFHYKKQFHVIIFLISSILCSFSRFPIPLLGNDPEIRPSLREAPGWSVHQITHCHSLAYTLLTRSVLEAEKGSPLSRRPPSAIPSPASSTPVYIVAWIAINAISSVGIVMANKWFVSRYLAHTNTQKSHLAEIGCLTCTSFSSQHLSPLSTLQ